MAEIERPIQARRVKEMGGHLKDAVDAGEIPKEFREHFATALGLPAEDRLAPKSAELLADEVNPHLEAAGQPTFSIRSKEEVDKILGKEHPKFSRKPQEALDFLLQHKEGYVPNAVHIPDVGNVDFIYGVNTGRKDSFGLAKIAGIYPEALAHIAELPQFRVVRESDGSVLLRKGDIEAVVKKYWFGEQRRWLLTAFQQKGEPAGETIDTANSGNAGREDDKLSSQSSDGNMQSGGNNVNPTFSIRFAEERQRFMDELDNRIHSDPEVYTPVWQKMRERVSLLKRR